MSEFWRTAAGRRAAIGVVSATAGAALISCGAGGSGTPVTGAAPPSGQHHPDLGNPHQTLVDAHEVDREFVGRVDGTDAYVAVALTTAADGTRSALAYLCDGRQLAALVTPAEGSTQQALQLTNAKRVQLTATVAPSTVTGTVALPDGRMLTFTADEVDPNGKAGLYLAPNELVGGGVADYGGWVVLPDGSQRGNIKLGNTVQPGGQINTGTGVVSGSTQEALQGRQAGFAYDCQLD